MKTINQERQTHYKAHPEDFKLDEVTVNEYGMVSYTVTMRMVPACKLATKRLWQTKKPVLITMMIITLIAIAMVIFG